MMAERNTGKESGQITFYILSHRGMVRQNNEDRVGVAALKTIKGKQALLAVLADGVGGHNAGEVASHIATDTIIAEVERTYPAQDARNQLEEAIRAANRTILESIEMHPERAGMGTTCVCALIIGHTLYAAHLGDSRLYLYRKRTLHQLTKDHTLYEDLVQLTGEYPQKSARNHPMAHVLSRYLGSPRSLEIDHQILGFKHSTDKLKLLSGDILLLCSDGITDLLTEREIEHILSTCSGRKCAQFLVYRALENGGHDNASAIVIQIP